MVAGERLVAQDGKEVCLFPCEAMYITPYRDPAEHDVYALDLLPYDANGNYISAMPVYAPFSGSIVYTGNDHNCILESDDRVHTPDGNLKFVRVLVAHDDNEPAQVGTHYTQGDLFYHSGNYGHSSGEHVHMEFAEVGSKSLQKWNNGGIGLFGGVHMWNATYVDNTAMLRALNFNWRKYGASPYGSRGKGKFPWVLYAEKLRKRYYTQF